MKGTTSINHFDFDTLYDQIAPPHFTCLEQEADTRRSDMIVQDKATEYSDPGR